MRRLFTLTGLLVVVIAIMTALMVKGSPRVASKPLKAPDLIGVVDDSFTEKVTQNVMTNQQMELVALRKELANLTKTLATLKSAHEEALASQNEVLRGEFNEQLKQVASIVKEEKASAPTPGIKNATLWHGAGTSDAYGSMALSTPRIHMVSFRKRAPRSSSRLNPALYVPSNTSVRAVILGGADADASVNGQSKNNGVMLFKFLEDGTLPNGLHSHLRGCRVSANAYGDISSERAFATLYKLSCAHRGQPIIDKEVSGWVFFNGKVGIKGQPLMRDNKVMTWAGISGALSGVAQAAQYAQSVQQFGAYGASSTVPSSHIAPFAAYGGAAKAADTLSQYYVKRAEQYHPVIQVGAGNVVTVVFKDGFYLTPEGESHASHEASVQQARFNDEPSNDGSINFTVPNEVLSQIDRVSTTHAQGGMQ
ncbi:TrbI/VirB10 family protein [Legionella donaldsonii]|uniref:TrbI/VirB10 family protein n=1 Tax=Legionella donaldsonii TaxID=45060 RepID=UPI001FE54ECA|nr:TrbI/VirB10 family protein [Legionella donaldsonii]